MEFMKTNTHSRQNGLALVMVLMSIMILLLLGTSLISMSTHLRLQAAQVASDISARTAADAAMAMAIDDMQDRLEISPWDNSALPEQSGALANSDETYTYKVTGNEGSGHTIEAIGYSGSSECKLTAVLVPTGLYEFAIYAKDQLDFKSKSNVTTINMQANDRPLEVGILNILASSMTMKSDVFIDGDILVGPGGNPSEVVNMGGGAISGDLATMGFAPTLPEITVPSGLAAMGSGGSITSDTTLSSDGHYDSINLENNKTLTIDGEVVLYITGDIVLGNNATIEVNNTNPNSSLTIYVNGKIEEKNGAAMNNLTEDSTKLSIYGLPGCQSIDFKNSGEFYGTLYAPYADVIVHNSMDVYGAMTAKSLEFKNSSNFYYDAALRESNFEDVGVQFAVKYWSQEY